MYPSVAELNLGRCGPWDGFSNNTVGGNVTHGNNVAIIVEDFGPDGNFVGGNSIGGNLNCFGEV